MRPTPLVSGMPLEFTGTVVVDGQSFQRDHFYARLGDLEIDFMGYSKAVLTNPVARDYTCRKASKYWCDLQDEELRLKCKVWGASLYRAMSLQAFINATF